MVTKRAYSVVLCLLVLALVLSGWGLSARFDATATIHYPFGTPTEGERNLTLTIPLRDYRDYKERPRPSYRNDLSQNAMAKDFLTGYSAMTADPDDDAIIDSVVRQLNEMAIANNLSGREKLDFVLSFVQSLAYTGDVATTPYFSEYPRYPVETLFEQRGDCEDTSILAAAILSEMGHDVALLLFEELDHMGLGITFPDEAETKMYGNSWIRDDDGDGKGEEDERRYWYLDTSGSWTIGWCPAEYAQTPAWVFPVR